MYAIRSYYALNVPTPGTSKSSTRLPVGNNSSDGSTA